MRTTSVTFALLLVAMGCRPSEPPLVAHKIRTGPEQRVIAPGSAMRPLAEYLEAEKPATWRQIRRMSTPEGRFFAISAQTHTWRGARWQNRIHVYVPNRLKRPRVLVVTLRAGTPTSENVRALGAWADRFGIANAVVYGIPNEPRFGKSGAELAAHTLEQAVENDDATWPIIAPMAKSVLRSLDVLQTWRERQGQPPFQRFVVVADGLATAAADVAAAHDSRIGALVNVGEPCTALSELCSHSAPRLRAAYLLVSSADSYLAAPPLWIRSAAAVARDPLVGQNHSDSHSTIASSRLDLVGAPEGAELADDRAGSTVMSLAAGVAHGRSWPTVRWSRDLAIVESKPEASRVTLWTKPADESGRWTSHLLGAASDRPGAYATELSGGERGIAVAEFEFDRDGEASYLTTPTIRLDAAAVGAATAIRP